jgi:hypothetical protein
MQQMQQIMLYGLDRTTTVPVIVRNAHFCTTWSNRGGSVYICRCASGGGATVTIPVALQGHWLEAPPACIAPCSTFACSGHDAVVGLCTDAMQVPSVCTWRGQCQPMQLDALLGGAVSYDCGMIATAGVACCARAGTWCVALTVPASTSPCCSEVLHAVAEALQQQLMWLAVHMQVLPGVVRGQCQPLPHRAAQRCCKL